MATPLEEHTKKVAESTNVGKDQEDIEIQNKYDSATRNNDARATREAELMAKGKAKEKNDSIISNPNDDSVFAATNEESRKRAVENLNEAKKNYKVDDTIVKDARNKQTQAENTYKTNVDNVAAKFDQMDQKTAAANASDVSNEIANEDPTTEQGLKSFEKYIDFLEKATGPKYGELSKSYNRALMFNAVQNGLAAAFGVPAIDFTQHPDVTNVRAQLDDMKQILKEMRTRASALKDKKLELSISGRAKNAEEQKKLEIEKLAVDKANVDSARQIADGTELSTNVLNTNMAKKAADDIYGMESAKARFEEAKIQGRGAKAQEHGAMSWGESTVEAIGNTGAKIRDKATSGGGILPPMVGGK